MISLFSFFFAFAVTFFIESIVYLFYLNEDFWNIIIPCFFINLITNPVANYLFHFIKIEFIVIEFLVLILESILIKYMFNLEWKKAFYLSIIANFLTAFFGIVLGLLV